MNAAKAVVAILLGILTAVGAALTDGAFTTDDWVAVAGATITAIGVYLVPNRDTSE